MSQRTTDAKEEIVEFLRSGEAGIKSDLTEAALKRAATNLFTEKGLDCPVKIVKTQDNEVFVLNRELVFPNSNGNHSTA